MIDYLSENQLSRCNFVMAERESMMLQEGKRELHILIPRITQRRRHGYTTYQTHATLPDVAPREAEGVRAYLILEHSYPNTECR